MDQLLVAVLMITGRSKLSTRELDRKGTTTQSYAAKVTLNGSIRLNARKLRSNKPFGSTSWHGFLLRDDPFLSERKELTNITWKTLKSILMPFFDMTATLQRTSNERESYHGNPTQTDV